MVTKYFYVSDKGLMFTKVRNMKRGTNYVYVKFSSLKSHVKTRPKHHVDSFITSIMCLSNINVNNTVVVKF